MCASNSDTGHTLGYDENYYWCTKRKNIIRPDLVSHKLISFTTSRAPTVPASLNIAATLPTFSTAMFTSEHMRKCSSKRSRPCSHFMSKHNSNMPTLPELFTCIHGLICPRHVVPHPFHHNWHPVIFSKAKYVSIIPLLDLFCLVCSVGLNKSLFLFVKRGRTVERWKLQRKLTNHFVCWSNRFVSLNSILATFIYISVKVSSSPADLLFRRVTVNPLQHLSPLLMFKQAHLNL